MGIAASSVPAVNEESCAGQLARFFSRAKAVRIPVDITAFRGGTTELRETTVVEFGSTDYAIFVSTLPLEFGDRIRLEKKPEGSMAEATVDAVQYHEGRKAVAARFLQGPCDWVMRQP